MSKKYIHKALFVILLFIINTSKAQSIRDRVEVEEDCSKTTFIYTNIDTLAYKQFVCEIYGMVINEENKNKYGLDYIMRVPKFMFINKTCRLKLFFEDNTFLEYGDINDPDYYDAGTEFEFRTIVYKNELKKMKTTKLSFLRLEKPGSHLDIPIEANYQSNLCNLAKFMLDIDALKQ